MKILIIVMNSLPPSLPLSSSLPLSFPPSLHPSLSLFLSPSLLPSLFPPSFFLPLSPSSSPLCFQLFNLDSSCMRLVLEVYYDGRHLANDSTSLKGEGLYRKHTVRNFKFYLLKIALFLSPTSFPIFLFLSFLPLSACLSLSPLSSLSPSLFLLSPPLSLSPLSLSLPLSLSVICSVRS